MVSHRTKLICQMRAFCLECGITIRQGVGAFKASLPAILVDSSNDLTATMRSLLANLYEDLKILEARIEEISRELESAAAINDRARRLMSIPGIGPLGATALIAAAGNGQQMDVSDARRLKVREDENAG